MCFSDTSSAISQGLFHLGKLDEKRRTSVAEEGKADPGVRNGISDNGDVQYRLKRDLACQSDDDEGGEGIGSLERYNEASPDKEHEKNYNEQRACKAELLCNYRENKVILRLRDVQMLLPAVSEPDPEKTAGADGVKPLKRLPYLGPSENSSPDGATYPRVRAHTER